MNEPRKRGRKEALSIPDKHEIFRYREAGVELDQLATMFGVSKSTLCKGLREISARLGRTPQLPAEKKHLARQQCFTCKKLPEVLTDR